MHPFSALWLIDSELRDARGHYFNYAQALAREAERRRLKVVMFGNKDAEVDVTTRIPVRPVFHGMTSAFLPVKGVGFLLDPLIGSWVHYRELRAHVPNGDGQTFAFAATANHRHLAALAGWLARFPPERSPTLAVLLRFGYFDAVRRRWAATTPLLKIGLRLLERTARTHRVHLVTDSEPLAREYRGLTSLPVTSLPIPHMLSEQAVASLERPVVIDRKDVRFVYLGEARHEKGFDVLVKALTTLHGRNESDGVTFAVQCHHSAIHPVGEWTKQLADLPARLVEPISEPLGTEAYYRLLIESDMVILPYRKAVYHARNSGVFADALAAGKPVVTTEDTWMSGQLTERGAGIPFRDGDVDDLVRALLEARRSVGELTAQAEAGRAAWIAEHDFSSFLDKLLRLASERTSKI